MIIFIITTTLFLIFLVAAIWLEDNGFGLLAIIFGFVFCIMFVVVLASKQEAISTNVKFKSMQETLDLQRSIGVSALERAAVTQKMMKMNAELAFNQYWAKNQWVSLFYGGKEILKVQPLK